VYKLNPVVDPLLESAWFQLLNYMKRKTEFEPLLSHIMQLVPLRRGGALHVESS
jgi:hypothetical protein